ncbi:heavy metal translocating P-type ATPase [Corallococcus macrosporus]|uniref:Heavy metal translocating P-type ATPase n=1 Tax=Corallococcus macrosporus TaxID=35 RepID=A0ABS3DC69_9BACT|nr:heavy metal translocating P-type ATPase [Corallococcus macrosporus]MBN8229268.1 heavy metal translocating P-type ATPase [Corallococcus macrosporus]
MTHSHPHPHPPAAPSHLPPPGTEGGPAIDPVCGMKVDPRTPRGGSWEHEGHTWFFCNPKCRQRFQADPGQFLQPRTPPPPAPKGAVYVCPMDPEVRQDAPGACPKCGMALEPEAPPVLQTRVEYTCPMHPEVVRDGPGTCPKCGMALEPRTATVEEPPDPELRSMTRRFWVGLLLSVPLMLLGMSDMVPGQPVQHALSPAALVWAQFALATPVVLWVGAPFFQRGWASVRNRHLNMFTLIALGAGAAYAFSVAATLFPHLLPEGARTGHGGTAPVYYEAAAIILTLVALGQVLELRARHATSGALRALLSLAPAMARRISDDGHEEDVPLSHVHAGWRLRVLPGGKVPVDGEVLEGASAVDESLVTGESVPVEKGPGAKVTGGTVNGTGTLVIRAERVGQDTLLSRIVQRVAEAQRTRAPIQRLADRVAGVFVPAVIAVALVTAVVWGVWGPEPRLAHALVNAVAVLIIACPCALGLATPMSVMVGTGQGARMGVLIRDAAALERMAAVDTLVVDKTGTLTEGKPRLVTVEPAPGVDASVLLRQAASLERGSEHPLAAAVVSGARERGVSPVGVEGFQAVPGQGVRGRVDGRDVALGNAALMRSLGVAVEALTERAEALRHEGQTVVLVSVDGRAAGLLGVEDPVKPSTPEALERLRAEGLRVVMLTGDSPTTAHAVARRLGITEVIAGVQPDAKGDAVKALQAQGRVVAMAGDGVNDAPALARADVGIAMGTGTDIAMESAGVTLVKGDLRGIARARALSQAVLRNIRQNLFFAFVYNLLGVPLAAGVLYPVFGLLLSPLFASAAMSLSSVSVIGNALRLRRLKS